MYIQTNPGLGQVTAAFDMEKAVRNNRIYGQQLGWQKYYSNIAKFLGFSVMPSESEFAQGVAQWQQSQGLKADGMLGPSTWNGLLLTGFKTSKTQGVTQVPVLGTRLDCAQIATNCADREQGLEEASRKWNRKIEKKKGQSREGGYHNRTQGNRDINLTLQLYDYDINDWIPDKAKHAEALGIAHEFIVNRIRKWGNDLAITITGSASRKGSKGYNDELSCKRANCVAQAIREGILARDMSLISKIRINTNGEGFTKATCDGNDCERAEWRSVLIQIHAVGMKPTPIPPVPPTSECPPAPSEPFTQKMISLLRRLLDEKLPKSLGKFGRFTPAIIKIFKITPPTHLRYLCKSEAGEAFKVFGGSLDLTKILIGDGRGPRGPFTVAIEHPDGWHVVMLLGDIKDWTTNKRRACTLIHELTHAWQSQHHSSDKQAFMWNSIKCQIAASIEPLIRDYRGAYAYFPGKIAFDDHSAEQIAQRVQDDYSGRQKSPTILKVIRSAGPNAGSPENENSLRNLRIYPKAHPGIMWPEPCK